MSLDIYLIGDQPVRRRGTGIFIREHGATRELTVAEAEARYPDQTINDQEYEGAEYYHANITHNLGSMAKEAGLYKPLWHPEEWGYRHARDLIPALENGLHALRADPTRFRPYNPDNGWGTYEQLVQFVDGLLQACRDWPDAKVRASI